MTETKNVRVTNKPSNPLWLIGFLFMLGYLAPLEIATTFWETIGVVLLTYVMWPLLLGFHLSGGL